MPDNRQIQATSTCLDVNANGSATDKLQDSMWRLKIHMGNQDGIDGHSNHYPDRPGEPDCIYYLRTGLCGYGSNCRYNHPTNTGQVIQSKGELPERVGQPDCQYFIKTGTCKYGVTCKYHHPRDRYDAVQVPLNVVGLPMRQGEKSCTYYMRTGSCKFGIACKFHHPQPAAIGAISPLAPSAYTGSSTALPSGLPYVGGLPAWSLSSAPYMSNSRVQGPPTYLPVVLSPSQGMIPRQQSWSTYTSSLNPVSSADALTLNLVYNSNLPGDPVSSASSSSIQLFPDRPDQPECRYYMKTGTCKYGTTCKYHHPKERNVPLPMDIVGPLGLPMRPGQAVCTFYSMYGICKYGSTCKYDHPLAGYYNYGLPALSVPDPVSITYQRNSQISLAQSSSESSPSRSSVRVTKPETASAKQQGSDKEAPENGTTQATSPSHTATISSDSPHDQSD